MAKFFSYYPKTVYTNSIVVDILTRMGIRENLQNNDDLFYNYITQDNETVDMIASKYYGDSNKHWLIMMCNNFFDHVLDMHMDYYVFQKYLDKKYKTEADLNETTGSEYARITQNADPFVCRIQIETSYIIYSIDGTFTEQSDPTYDIYYTDSNTANTIIEETITFGDITKTTTKEMLSIYDWEEKLNEDRRTIKLLKKEYAINIEYELKNLQ